MIRLPVRLFCLSLVCLATLLIVAPLPAVEPAPKSELVPGQSYFGHDQHIEYIAGDLPFILSVPHGGREKPEAIADRKEGTFAFDVGTQELARAIAVEMHRQTGHWPHVVICRISRRKIDCNREMVEACAGNPAAEAIWHDWHRFLGTARDRVVQDFGRGLYIDLHGHGHKVPQLEMGYLHSVADYDVSDEQLGSPQNIAASSLQAIAALNRRPYAELVRGDFALGTLMMERGFPASPSKERPQPAAPYFRGGYNTGRYARDGAPLAGLQIETNSRGVRDNDKSRAAFAVALTDALEIFFEAQLGIPLAPKPVAAKPQSLATTHVVASLPSSPKPACHRRGLFRRRCR